MEDFKYLTELSGTPQERAWLMVRLETLSVRESYALSASITQRSPESMSDAINCLHTLDDYDVCLHAGTYEQLGRFYLDSIAKVPDIVRGYVDIEQAGRLYENLQPGMFKGSCYVEFHEGRTEPIREGNKPLLPDTDWSVKLKLASTSVPDGVWIRLPDYSEIIGAYASETELALDALNVRQLEECTLLEARCILPEAGNLMEQYDSVSELIRDGNNLCFVLDEHGQGDKNFMEKPDLRIVKKDADTGEYLPGAVFKVKKADGATLTAEETNDKGEIILKNMDPGVYEIIEEVPPVGYLPARQSSQLITLTANKLGTVIFTGPNGSFTVTGLSEGAYIVEELSSDSGHVIDSAPQTAYISGKQTDVVELYFGNTPKGRVLIKKIDAVSHEPLSDVEFLVTDSEGTLIGNANGKFITDSAGTILIDNLAPSTTLVVKETRAKSGYVLDDAPQTIKVRAGHTVSLEFRNMPHGSLIIQKRDSVTGAPLEGVTFVVKTSTGEYVANNGGTISSNGEYVTDANGQIILTGLKPDTYIVTELVTISGYILDTTARSIVVNANDTQTLNVTNTPKGSLVVQKIDSITKEPLAGAEFRITTSDGTLADSNEGLTSSNGLYVTDANGQIYLTNLTPATYIISETRAPENYRLDASVHAIVVRGADTQTVTVSNDPLCTLTILKRDASTKEPLRGAEFQVKYSDGTTVGANNGHYTTGSDGTVTVSGLKPDSTVIVTEEKAPTGYLKDDEAKTIVVRSGAANSLTFDDEPTTTLVIRKYISGSDYEPIAGVCFKVTDLDLTQREMSYTAIADLRDKYHSGDRLNCIVKEYDRRKNHLVISVKETVPNPFDGADFRHPEGSHRYAVIAGKYAGGVFCNLSDGVTIMCNYAFHYDDSAFNSGDRVLLIIQRYDMEKKQIYGKIVAKV